MTATDDEVRGSTPVMTTKDVLLEVRADVKLMAKDVGILVSQNLDTRLNAVETWKDQLTGKIIAIAAVPTALALWSILRDLGIVPSFVAP